MLSSGPCRYDTVTHRDLPAAEKADLTTYRYQPPRCLALPGAIFTATVSWVNDISDKSDAI